MNVGALLQAYVAPRQLEEYPNILIYGAGYTGKDVYRSLIDHDLPVAAFLDRKALSGDKLDGVLVYHPDWNVLSSVEREQVAVIIAIHNRSADVASIARMLAERGYRQIITLVEFYDRFFADMGERYWLTSREAYPAWQAEISAGNSVWADDASRQLYQMLLRMRLTGDYAVLPKPDSEHQYYPPDVPDWETPLRLVDCGAFDGDTLRAFLASKYTIQSGVAFEPEPDNFRRLVDFVSTSCLDNITLWPCGIHSQTQQMCFAGDKGESSKLVISGNKMIQAVALDDVIPHFKPNLIKMDIEGAEIEGLIGAQRIIQQNRPGLAVCVYHKPQHLWQIPLLVQSWKLGYRLYLRTHGYNGFDVVMYAIPGE